MLMVDSEYSLVDDSFDGIGFALLLPDDFPLHATVGKKSFALSFPFLVKVPPF